VFNYSAEATKATPILSDADAAENADYNPLERQNPNKDKGRAIPDEELEGYDDDATITKVVDRRWYERNKHIFPASVWEEYNPEKNFSNAQRKDTEGNSFFFS
jgi:protein FAM50